jgi:type IV secretory pathway VirB10-like protein
MERIQRKTMNFLRKVDKMRKIIIFLVAVLLIGTIAAAGCTSNQMPKDNNQIPEMVLNTTNSTNITHNVTAVTTVKPTATPASPTAYPTPVPTYNPTPVPPAPQPSPIPTPKPQCTHIDITVYHPLNSPCMMCAERYGTLSPYAQEHSPYVTCSFAAIDNSTWSASTVRISATVRETGQTMSWDASHGEPEVMVWCNSYLTCK